jgi:hypothetical protein
MHHANKTVKSPDHDIGYNLNSPIHYSFEAAAITDQPNYPNILSNV